MLIIVYFVTTLKQFRIMNVHKDNKIMAEKLREAYIDSIMINKYDDDDPEKDRRNRAFLQTLTLEELQNLCDEIILEDKL